MEWSDGADPRRGLRVWVSPPNSTFGNTMLVTLKSAMVAVFTPWKSANAASQDFFPKRLIIEHLLLDAQVCKFKNKELKMTCIHRLQLH